MHFSDRIYINIDVCVPSLKLNPWKREAADVSASAPILTDWKETWLGAAVLPAESPFFIDYFYSICPFDRRFRLRILR